MLSSSAASLCFFFFHLLLIQLTHAFFFSCFTSCFFLFSPFAQPTCLLSSAQYHLLTFSYSIFTRLSWLSFTSLFPYSIYFIITSLSWLSLTSLLHTFLLISSLLVCRGLPHFTLSFNLTCFITARLAWLSFPSLFPFFIYFIITRLFCSPLLQSSLYFQRLYSFHGLLIPAFVLSSSSAIFRPSLPPCVNLPSV